ncbi:uncharacterized protein LOC142974081 [Anticarsia gemmatalis]|uniref:uncharacterized protein LOC142974081 n=1 Tax=Anticarsia gemmatalis TaxID=129554 RepID=UPI003F767112
MSRRDNDRVPPWLLVVGGLAVVTGLVGIYLKFFYNKKEPDDGRCLKIMPGKIRHKEDRKEDKAPKDKNKKKKEPTFGISVEPPEKKCKNSKMKTAQLRVLKPEYYSFCQTFV